MRLSRSCWTVLEETNQRQRALESYHQGQSSQCHRSSAALGNVSIWHSAKRAGETGQDTSLSLPFASPAGHCLATLCRVCFQKTNRITRWATSAEGLSVPAQSRDWAVHSGALGFPDSRLLTGGPLTQALIFMCKGEKLIGFEWKKQWYFILSRLKVESLVLPCRGCLSLPIRLSPH